MYFLARRKGNLLQITFVFSVRKNSLLPADRMFRKAEKLYYNQLGTLKGWSRCWEEKENFRWYRLIIDRSYFDIAHRQILTTSMACDDDQEIYT